MEHIFFEVRLCLEMLNFKEKHAFPILVDLGIEVIYLIGPHKHNAILACGLLHGFGDIDVQYIEF